MKYIVSVVILSLFVCGANAATNARPAMSGKMIMTAPRYTASINQLGGNPSVSVKSDPVMTAPTTQVDRREAERNACINNNIGVGNTFVWASRYSNTLNYSTMIEDTENPQNNVCFARVEIKSDDPKISVADIPAKYFMWGETIECGSWVDDKEMEQRILDAKKGARVGGIVASTVGGAGLGVGIMEAFGNRLIDGQVMGQKAKNLETIDLYKSQLLVMYDKDRGRYDEVVKALKILAENNEKVDGINAKDLLNKLK